MYCNACIDGFGVALEQEQPDRSVRPTAYISRATLDSERHRTPLDVEAANNVWTIKTTPRLPIWGARFHISSDRKTAESIGKVGAPQRARPAVARVSHRVRLHARVPEKGSDSGNVDFVSRLPEPATEHDRGESSSLAPVEHGGIFLIRAFGLRTCSSSTPGAGLGELVPRHR